MFDKFGEFDARAMLGDRGLQLSEIEKEILVFKILIDLIRYWSNANVFQVLDSIQRKTISCDSKLNVAAFLNYDICLMYLYYKEAEYVVRTTLLFPNLIGASQTKSPNLSRIV